MITFLFPEFLWALGLLAIPLFIHLFQFRRFKKVYFSNTGFLKHIQTISRKSRELKRWLVLLTRCLTLIFLVLAFAQPIIPDQNLGKASESNAVSIYIDNSYSMNLSGKNGPLLQQAMDRAKELVRRFGETDKFQLLTNDFEGRHQHLVTRDEMLRWLEEIKTSPNSRTACEVMERQKQALSAAPQSKHIAYIFSDFQKPFTSNCTFRSDSFSKFTWVPMRAEEVKNISIDTCWFEFPYFRKDAVNELNVVIANYGEEKIENGSVHLNLNGQPVTVGNFTAEPGQKTTARLSFTCRKTGWQSAELSLTDNPINFDDHLYFSFEVLDHTEIYIINGPKTGDAIQKVYQTDPFFKLYVSELGQVDYHRLRNCGIIILNGVSEPGSGLQEELLKHLNEGGDLMLFPPAGQMLSKSYIDFANALGLGIAGEYKNYDGAADKINFKSVIFKDAFEKTSGEIKLPEVKKYISLRTAAKGYESLISLRGGAPLLAAVPSSKGHIYFCAAPLESEYCQLANHALFVPFMLKAGLLSTDPMPLFFRTGKNQFISLNKELPASEGGFRLQGAGIEIIPQLMNRGGRSVLYISDALQKPGNYILKTGQNYQPGISFNAASEESVMEYSGMEELEKLSNNDITISEEEKVTSASAWKDGTTRLWKTCLWLALLFILIEVALIKWMKS